MNKEFKNLSTNVMLCEREDTAELEYQENLPQYCEDIERVIRCSGDSVITDYEYINSSVKIYGKTRISLVYVGASGCCRQAEFEETFTKNTECPPTEHFAFADLKCCTRFTNLRLINQRKIDVHTSVRIFSRVYEHCSVTPMSQCDGIIAKNESVESLQIIACATGAADFDEEFILPSGSADVETVINTYSYITVEEKKIIKDKMLVKCKVDLSVTYTDPDSNIQKASFCVNASKIIDIDSVDETNTAFVRAAVSSLFVKAVPDENNDMRKLQIAGGIIMSYCVMDKRVNTYITDAYSTEHKSDAKSMKISVCKSPQYFYDTKTVVTDADCDDDDIVEIIDMSVSIINAYIKSSTVHYELQTDVMFYNSKSEIVCSSLKNDLSMALDGTSRDGICAVNLLSFDYVLKASNKIELRLNEEYTAYLYDFVMMEYVSDIDVSEDIFSESPVLTLYFARENEDVWDIAKKFNTDSRLIMQENDISTDKITNSRILLVPGV